MATIPGSLSKGEGTGDVREVVKGRFCLEELVIHPYQNKLRYKEW